MPKSRTNKSRLSDHICEADGCTERTGFRRDGTPRKYAVACGHQAESRERMKAVFAKGAAERKARDDLFTVVLELAMTAGEEARQAANPLSSSTGAHITFKPTNSAWVNFLRRQAIGDTNGTGYVVRFPDAPGSVAQARAIADVLRPLTASGEALQGLRLTVS